MMGENEDLSGLRVWITSPSKAPRPSEFLKEDEEMLEIVEDRDDEYHLQC